LLFNLPGRTLTKIKKGGKTAFKAPKPWIEVSDDELPSDIEALETSIEDEIRPRTCRSNSILSNSILTDAVKNALDRMTSIELTQEELDEYNEAHKRRSLGLKKGKVDTPHGLEHGHTNTPGYLHRERHK
jgi:hypothetical protein